MRSGIYGVIKGECHNFGYSQINKCTQKVIQTNNSILHGTWLEKLNYPVDELLSNPEKFNTIEGPVQGCYFDQKSSTLTIHVDFARQHPIFYYSSDKVFAFAHSLEKLIGILKENDIVIRADENGAALLLSYASILGDKTIVQGVRKLMPGHSLVYVKGEFKLINRDNLQNLERSITDKSKAIDMLDDVFSKATDAMVRANSELNADQINLLSGGIDSRMVFMQTIKSSENINTLCFSAKGYLDHTISEQISSDFKANYNFCDLNPGNYVMCTDSVEDYDGTINYLASAHHRYALKNFTNQGIIASGQLGNEILAEFYTPNCNFIYTLDSISTMKGVGIDAKEIWDITPESTLFKLYNRGFLYTNSAAYSTVNGTLYSPFTSKEFVITALQLHPSLLKNHYIYLEWMKSKYPEAIRYNWERYKSKPVGGMSLKLAKLKMSVLTRFIYPLSKFRSSSMSPLQYWFNESQEIQQFFENTFVDNMEHLDSVPSLASFVKQNYGSMNITNKASVLTLLMALKKYVNS